MLGSKLCFKRGSRTTIPFHKSPRQRQISLVANIMWGQIINRHSILMTCIDTLTYLCPIRQAVNRIVKHQLLKFRRVTRKKGQRTPPSKTVRIQHASAQVGRHGRPRQLPCAQGCRNILWVGEKASRDAFMMDSLGLGIPLLEDFGT